MTNLSPKQKHRFQNQGRHKNSIHDQVDRTISRNKSSRSEMKITPCDCSHNKDIGVKEQAMGIVLQFTNKEWPRTHQNLRGGGNQHATQVQKENSSKFRTSSSSSG